MGNSHQHSLHLEAADDMIRSSSIFKSLNSHNEPESTTTFVAPQSNTSTLTSTLSILPSLPQNNSTSTNPEILQLQQEVYSSFISSTILSQTQEEYSSYTFVPEHIREEDVQKVFAKLSKINKSTERKILWQSAIDRCNIKWFLQRLFNKSVLEQNISSLAKDVSVSSSDATHLQVKLVIADLDNAAFGTFKFGSTNLKRFAKFVSKEVKFGVVHLALQVGPYLLHFFSDSMVTISKIASANCSLVLDLKHQISLEETFDDSSTTTPSLRPSKQILDLCSKIVEWNINKLYDNRSCNCQTFVLDVLKTLSIDIDAYISQCPALHEYFQSLYKIGHANTKRFKHPETGEIKTFDSHEQLDQYISTILLNNSDFPAKFPDSWLLLKSFDRAFWVQHVKQREKFSNDTTQWKKECIPSEQGCPFADPQQSGSMPIMIGQQPLLVHNVIEDTHLKLIKCNRTVPICQYPEYPTGCELVAAQTFLRSIGVECSVEQLWNWISKGTIPHQNEEHDLVGGNPNRSFLGDPKTKDGLGVFEKPILESIQIALQQQQRQEWTVLSTNRNYSLYEICYKMEKEKAPAIVWITLNCRPSYVCYTWKDDLTGNYVEWRSPEHCVVLVGCKIDETFVESSTVYIADPHVGKIVEYPFSLLQKRFVEIGKRAVVAEQKQL